MRVMTSWDDGHPLDLRISELLSQCGLAGTFFVPTVNREGRPVMNGAQLRELNSIHEVGSHTFSHHYLLDCSPEIANFEIVNGKQQLEQELGMSVSGFCYPGGRFNAETTRLIQEAGFRYARTIENLCFDTGPSSWHIPTTLQFYPHSATTLAKNALRHLSREKVTLVAKRLRTPCFYDFLRQTAEYCAHAAGTFHLWGHSWEIEEYGLWNELENFLRFLASLSSSSMTLSGGILGITEQRVEVL